ncbi:MAG: hypothetical protein JRG86_14800 [Deltaproteobacteria bacterium]|nr:hypothetical protein [Deltaproteobacteria bacterium]MBW2498738.1 hypothetical protein [Deltaproteobacteria bacterium]
MLSAYELAIRQWALHDALAARTVRRVNRRRLDFVGAAFAELGFEGDDLEVRTRLVVVDQSFVGPMFPKVSRKRRRELIEERIALLTAP